MSFALNKPTQRVSRAGESEDERLKRPPRHWFSRIPTVLEMPKLIQTQIDSFEWFKREGLRELFDEISPISDFTGKSMELHFPSFSNSGEYRVRNRISNLLSCSVPLVKHLLWLGSRNQTSL